MPDYRLSEQADADLEAITIYSIETFGLGQAEKYKLALELGFERLAGDPRLGRRFETRLGTFRRYLCESPCDFLQGR